MFTTLTAAALVVAYNTLATVAELSPVKRFSDRAVGAKRLGDLVEKLRAAGKVVDVAEDGTATAIDPAPVVELKPEPVRAAKTAKVASGGAKSLSVADSDVIYVLASANPKKGTAADRYSNYADGVTVEAYIAAVGDRRQGLRDIAWDSRKGWIEVIGAAAARKREKARLAAEVAATASAEVEVAKAA